MPIKRDSCRQTERQRMRRMAQEGYSTPQIANALSVNEHIVTAVLDGTWEKQESAQKKEQKKLDEQRAKAAELQAEAEKQALADAVAAGIRATQEQPEAPAA